MLETIPVPARVTIGGLDYWSWADGTLLRVISGGDGSGEGDDIGTDAGAGTGDAGSGDADGKAKTFSQADVDRIVKDRLARVPAKPADYDNIKAKADKFDELDEAQKTELQKANDRADAAEKRANEAVEASKTHARRAAIMAEATKAGAANADTVFKLLASDTTVTVADDGTVTGASEAVHALLEAETYLKAPAGAGGGTGANDGGNAGGNGSGKFDGGARGGGGEVLTQSLLKTMSPEAVAKLTPQEVADAMGRP